MRMKLEFVEHVAEGDGSGEDRILGSWQSPTISKPVKMKVASDDRNFCFHTMIIGGGEVVPVQTTHNQVFTPNMYASAFGARRKRPVLLGRELWSQVHLCMLGGGCCSGYGGGRRGASAC